MARQRYFLSIDNLATARGQISELSFQDSSPEAFAAQLQAALREPTLWERWRALQPDPDAVDPSMGVSDPAATVSVTPKQGRTDVVATTSLPHAVIRHRLGMLIGAHWSLHDVAAA